MARVLVVLFRQHYDQLKIELPWMEIHMLSLVTNWAVSPECKCRRIGPLYMNQRSVVWGTNHEHGGMRQVRACDPHKNWKMTKLQHGWKMTNHIPKDKWNYKLNPNSLPNTSQWLVFFLLVAYHFSSVIFLLLHCHLQHVRSFPPSLLYNTHFSQCWSLCDLHLPLSYLPKCIIFYVLWLFCKIIVRLPSMQLLSLVAPSSLSLYYYNNLGYSSMRLTSLSNKRIKEEKF